MPHLHVIQQLDSGFGIQIPTKFLEQIGVHGNDNVEINCQEDIVVIRRFPSQCRTLDGPHLDRK